MVANRTLKWILLLLLFLTTFFLASFNATLRYIIDQRRDLHEANRIEARKKAEERRGWEEAAAEIHSRRQGLDGLGSDGRSSSSSSSSGGGEDVAPTPSESDDASSSSLSNILDKHSTSSKGSQEASNLAQEIAAKVEKSTADRAARLLQEQENPTLGIYRTTQRPLDGIVDDESGRGYRPPVSTFGGENKLNDTPGTHSRNKSVTLVADAHYAKALRMLSSNFDSKKDGGNALPQRVYWGDYDQALVDENNSGGKKSGGRGDKFVREVDLMSAGSNGGRGGRGRVKKRRGKRVKKDQRKMESAKSSKSTDENEFSLLDALEEYAIGWYEDALDLLYDTLGMELEPYDVVDDEEEDQDENNAAAAADNVFGINNGENTGRVHYNEEDIFSWRDTRVGSQLLWIFGKIKDALSSKAQWRSEKDKSFTASSQSSSDKSTSGASPTAASSHMQLSRQDQLAREGLFHLEKAAELGHAEAQRMVANSLASGILPLSDHSLMSRIGRMYKNKGAALSHTRLQVPDDFSTGSTQLSRAILLWHLSAMSGNVESAMALGYRHLYSATGGSTLLSDLIDDKAISSGYHPTHGGVMNSHGGSASGSGGSGAGHYGVLGTCGTALAYYEAAAHGVMDALEGGATRGKVSPPIDEHRLAEIYTHGGASVALDSNNKPDELEEALQYYRMLASRSRSPEPDLVAAYTIANFYLNGYRGVRQDLRLALKYYEICGDYNHWEGGGQAGLMHVWGIGMSPDERDLGKAYAYFSQGTPGGLDGCLEKLRKKKKQNNKNSMEEVVLCDRHCSNGMGLLNLLGVEGLIDRDVNTARRWFEHSKELGDADASYNYAMLRLGWMVTEIDGIPTNATEYLAKDPAAKSATPQKKSALEQNYMMHRAAPADMISTDKYSGPSQSDYNLAIQELQRASSKGHIQAKHRLGILHASGASVPKKNGKPTKVISQSCVNALRYFKSVADAGHTISRRNRAAWKQYNAGDYESSLRNYLSSAETGSEIGQVNAAFLLEQGYCLGMTTEDCTKASVRLWRAAARQGNLEACLRVGDFYYYGRMKAPKVGAMTPTGSGEGDAEGVEMNTVYDREEYLSSLEAKAFYFIPGPYRWTRYVLYPEELFDAGWKWASRSLHKMWRYVTAKLSDTDTEDEADDLSCADEAEGTCAPEWSEQYHAQADAKEEDDNHMAIAAQYYRKAAEEHKSARANFNLGFMHEWGLGLKQDFPLAKRHYDLASQDNTNMAAAIALHAMNIHQKMVKLGMKVKEYARNNDMLSHYKLFSDEPSQPMNSLENHVESKTEGQIKPQLTSTQKTKPKHEVIPLSDIVNDMYFSPESDESSDGFFPEHFENGFDQLPWKANLWTIEETKPIGQAPFKGKYSAYATAKDVSETTRATLQLEINSANGGRICFYLYADLAMPWHDFRFSLGPFKNSIEYPHDNEIGLPSGTKRSPGIWEDMCFDIPAGKQTLEWSLTSPHYYDELYGDEYVNDLIETSKHFDTTPVGEVMLDNIRFFPFVYDDFETGDFSLTKWRQTGDGAPWRITEEGAKGRYSAYVSPTPDTPNGVSTLELTVDVGYTGAMLEFYVKTRTDETGGRDMLWFRIDGHKIRPWFGDLDEFHLYKHYIKEGVHTLKWSFECSTNDLNAAAWLDDVRFYTREGTEMLRPSEPKDLSKMQRKIRDAKPSI